MLGRELHVRVQLLDLPRLGRNVERAGLLGAPLSMPSLRTNGDELPQVAHALGHSSRFQLIRKVEEAVVGCHA